MDTKRFLFLGVIIVLGIAARLLPHPWNFTPIGALAIFCGMMFPGWWGIAIPIIAMLISDAIIGFYDWRQMAMVYAAFIAMVALGKVSYGVDSPKNVALSMLAGSILFFLISNFAVWITGGGEFYGRTLGGLLACYAAALPFFRNQFIGDFLYVYTFFGLWWMARARWFAKNTRAVQVKSKK